ncbi:unnamed protein product [[Candida] boidinii]|uniref:Unnamed protein product n=1 Tax=Candida boidinii TaxID=5477 RepID=A0A9W6W9V1_CANBO|nr:hydrolase activity protein [[Candida] boidinii]OWB81414.1 hydrolase activity protein [[Candida] boidinii]GME70500.1 unnamed protein product [[Candida] boidinii]
MALFPLMFSYKDQIIDESQYMWGPITSTIDWCEENYVVSSYFAEFINATTNLSFFYLSMLNLRSCIKNKHEFIFQVVSVGMCIVGLGSWFFHMTLKYEFQLLDELPMIYVTAIPFSYILTIDIATNKSGISSTTTNPNPIKKSKNFLSSHKAQSIAIYSANLFFVLGITIYYIFINQNPVFHEVCYALLNFGLIYKIYQLINRVVSYKSLQMYMLKLMAFSVGEFLFGFILWNIDNKCCSNLRSLRRSYLGFPLGIFLELHGWWHILTSLGIYHFIVVNQMLSVWHRGEQENYRLVWKYGILGQVVLNENINNNLRFQTIVELTEDTNKSDSDNDSEDKIKVN